MDNRPAKKSRRFFYGYIIIFTVFVLQVVMYGSKNSFGVFFKPILEELGWSRALISGASSLSAITQGLSGIVMGALNDRVGPRVVVTLCGVLLGIGYVLMSRISTPWHLYLFYVAIIGTGMGGLIAPQMSTVVRWFTRRRSLMTGIVIAGGGTGGFFLPPIINWLITTTGWRDAFAIMGIIVLSFVILMAQLLRRDPSRMGQVPHGEVKGKVGEPDISMVGLSLGEARRTGQFWMLIVLLYCFGFVVSTMAVHIVAHATDLGISPATAASIFGASGLAIVLGSILMGFMADRFGNRRVAIFAFTLFSVAFFWLLFARDAWMLCAFTFAVGLAHGSMSAIQSPIIAEFFGVRSHGLLLGVCNFCLLIGSASGPFVAGYIYDVSGSYQLAFIICAVASVTGLVLAMLLRPIQKPGLLAGLP